MYSSTEYLVLLMLSVIRFAARFCRQKPSVLLVLVVDVCSRSVVYSTSHKAGNADDRLEFNCVYSVVQGSLNMLGDKLGDLSAAIDNYTGIRGASGVRSVVLVCLNTKDLWLTRFLTS
jgi:hypothetical protein